MTSYPVQLQQLESIPLAVIRRQATPSELSRVVPECCGLVWNAVRAQQAKGGRHVAVYWDGGIRLEVGVELHLAGPRWEIYGHWQNEWNANPSQIRTDVFYLLGSPATDG